MDQEILATNVWLHTLQSFKTGASSPDAVKYNKLIQLMSVSFHITRDISCINEEVRNLLASSEIKGWQKLGPPFS